MDAPLVDPLTSGPVGRGDTLEARRLRGSVDQNERALVDTLTSWPVDKEGRWPEPEPGADSLNLIPGDRDLGPENEIAALL